MTVAPDPTPEAPREPGRLLTGERAGYAALAISVVALGLAAAPWLTGGSPVREYLLKHAEVLQEASAALENKGQQAQAEAITQRAAANPALLAVDATDPAFGPADAKVTVIEFFDFRCPGCKATPPEVLRLMQAHPHVLLVLSDVPIRELCLYELSHDAARAAQAAHAQGKYLPVFRALMAEPGLTREAVDRILAANGVTGAEAVMASPATARHLASIDAAGAALQLYGTPTFFVNGKAQASINPVDLERAIEQAG
jgi:protein-disulfide isomerase